MSELGVEATIAADPGVAERTVSVNAFGTAAPGAQRLYVSWDDEREACPDLLEDLPQTGGWVFDDPDAALEYVVVGPGAFDLTRTIQVDPGRLRLCGYLLDPESEADPVPVENSFRVAPDPSAPLTRAAAIDVLLASPRVHRDVKAWIVQGEAWDELGLGVNGSGYLRLTDLTGDGLPEAVVQPSAGGAGRVHAYYIVTNDGGRLRVAAAVRKAFNGTIQSRWRGFREIIPRYAKTDALCCASRKSVRTFRWNGRRFVQTSARVVRTRFYRPPVPRPAPPALVPQPRSRPAPPGPAASSGYNCDDFPLSDGTSAQAYLQLYPSDPSGLDGDNDGVACEG